MRNDSIDDFDLSQFDSIMSINLRAVVILTNLAVPHLEKTKGNIINVSSIAGLKARPNRVSYAVSKAALDQFTKCCALDLAAKGIRVNSVNPGAIRTSLTETLGMSKEESNKFYERYKTRYPVGRVGEVEDTSIAIAYLASEKASFLTGILLPVDGGSMVAGV